MQGLNADVSVYRERPLADDAAGGAQILGYTFVAAGRGRVSTRPATLEMRAQGLGTDDFFDALVQPATLDIQTKDILIPTSGPFQWTEFLVTGVLRPPMNFHSPRAHLKLQLRRWDEGKILAVM